MKRPPALVVLILAGCQTAFGWGELGHRVMVRIAESLLTSEARSRVQETLMPGESLVDLASWADDYRAKAPRTAPWHYVDIPLNSHGLDLQRDCPKGACVVTKIAEFQQKWSNPARSPADRREALLFLIHLVGDLHQPLHCENNQDDGGNQVRVRFFGEETNLHSVWDTGMLKRAGDEDHLYAKLAAALTPDRLAAWPSGTIEQWANESFRLAQGTAYGLLPVVPPGGTMLLGAWYQSMAEPIAEMQLEKAAVRLASLLNQAAH